MSPASSTLLGAFPAVHDFYICMLITTSGSSVATVCTPKPGSCSLDATYLVCLTRICYDIVMSFGKVLTSQSAHLSAEPAHILLQSAKRNFVE